MQINHTDKNGISLPLTCACPNRYGYKKKITVAISEKFLLSDIFKDNK